MESFIAIMYAILVMYFIFYLCKLVLSKREQCCYILDYVCYKGPDDRKFDAKSCVEIVQQNKNLGLEEYRFLLRAMVSSGIGDETYCPRNIIEGREETPTLVDPFSEMNDMIFTTLDELFGRAMVSPSEIDILVVTISLFSPVPSFTSRIVNRYRMRHDIRTFNFSGLGC